MPRQRRFYLTLLISGPRLGIRSCLATSTGTCGGAGGTTTGGWATVSIPRGTIAASIQSFSSIAGRIPAVRRRAQWSRRRLPDRDRSPGGCAVEMSPLNSPDVTRRKPAFSVVPALLVTRNSLVVVTGRLNNRSRCVLCRSVNCKQWKKKPTRRVRDKGSWTVGGGLPLRDLLSARQAVIRI